MLRYWLQGCEAWLVHELLCSSFQYHSQYSHSAEKGKADLFSLSYAVYGWKSGVWRLLDLAA